MSWLLPLSLVLLVALALAGAHFLFVRWMARQPEPVVAHDGDEENDGSTGVLDR
jgi:hypothetical protein